jgi:hypothetical protein
MDTSALTSLFIINELDTDNVEIRLGWKLIANLEQEGGIWYVTIFGKDLTVQCNTKEDAFKHVVGYFTP